MANRAASAPMQAYNNAYTSSYKPWETAPSTVNYGMVGGGPIPFGDGNQTDSMTPTKVYAILPNCGGRRDFNKSQPVGVVKDGKVYPVAPNSGGLRDYGKIQPIGIVGNQ